MWRCLIPIPQVQYEYETGDHTHIQVYERTLESPYTFSLPTKVIQTHIIYPDVFTALPILLQLLKTLSSEVEGVVSVLEKSGVSADHVTKYIGDLRDLAKAYKKVCKYTSPNF